MSNRVTMPRSVPLHGNWALDVESAPEPINENQQLIKKLKDPKYVKDPRLLLREMERVGKLAEFLNSIPLRGLRRYYGKIDFFTNCYILDTTGKLRDAAIEWMKALRGEEVKSAL